MLAMLSKEPARKYELKNEKRFVKTSIGLLAKIQNVAYTAVFFSMPWWYCGSTWLQSWAALL